MLALGEMEAGEDGDWLCVNVDEHATVQIFDTEDQMRAHLLECHGIPRTDKISMYSVPDNSTELAPRLRKPSSHSNSQHSSPCCCHYRCYAST